MRFYYDITYFITTHASYLVSNTGVVPGRWWSAPKHVVKDTYHCVCSVWVNCWFCFIGAAELSSTIKHTRCFLTSPICTDGTGNGCAFYKSVATISTTNKPRKLSNTSRWHTTTTEQPEEKRAFLFQDRNSSDLKRLHNYVVNDETTMVLKR